MTRFNREKTSRVVFVEPDRELEGPPLPEPMVRALGNAFAAFDQVLEVHLVHSLDRQDDRERKWAVAVVFSQSDDELESEVFKTLAGGAVRGGPEIRMVPMDASDPRLAGLRAMGHAICGANR